MTIGCGRQLVGRLPDRARDAAIVMQPHRVSETVALIALGRGRTIPIVPIDVVRDGRRRWVFARATGTLSLIEVLTLIQTARADVEHRMWPMLVDARAATTDATEADVMQAVEAVRNAVQLEGPRGHVAIVVDDDRLYARTLLYETKCADIGVRLIRVFRHHDDAERWLEIVSAARHFR